MGRCKAQVCWCVHCLRTELGSEKTPLRCSLFSLFLEGHHICAARVYLEPFLQEVLVTLCSPLPSPAPKRPSASVGKCPRLEGTKRHASCFSPSTSSRSPEWRGGSRCSSVFVRLAGFGESLRTLSPGGLSRGARNKPRAWGRLLGRREWAELGQELTRCQPQGLTFLSAYCMPGTVLGAECSGERLVACVPTELDSSKRTGGHEPGHDEVPQQWVGRRVMKERCGAWCRCWVRLRSEGGDSRAGS